MRADRRPDQQGSRGGDGMITPDEVNGWVESIQQGTRCGTRSPAALMRAWRRSRRSREQTTGRRVTSRGLRPRTRRAMSAERLGLKGRKDEPLANGRDDRRAPQTGLADRGVEEGDGPPMGSRHPRAGAWHLQALLRERARPMAPAPAQALILAPVSPQSAPSCPGTVGSSRSQSEWFWLYASKTAQPCGALVMYHI